MVGCDIIVKLHFKIANLTELQLDGVGVDFVFPCHKNNKNQKKKNPHLVSTGRNGPIRSKYNGIPVGVWNLSIYLSFKSNTGIVHNIYIILGMLHQCHKSETCALGPPISGRGKFSLVFISSLISMISLYTLTILSYFSNYPNMSFSS